MSTQFKILVGILFTLATLVVLIVLYLNEDNRMSGVAAAFQGRSIEQGASYFETYCVTCHGRHGEGIPGLAPPLNRKDLLDTKNAPYLKAIKFGGTLDDFLHDTIAAGRPQPSAFYSSQRFANPMPTWSQDYGGPLRPDQVDSLVLFIENWAPGQYEPLVALNQTPSAPSGSPSPAATTAAGCNAPAPYGCAKPPFALPPTGDVIAAGKAIFMQPDKCVVCHGVNADGNAPAAAGFAKKPRNFTDCTAMQQFPMDLHYQRVNEGTPNGMPAWKGNLSDLQIWQVIMYERSFCQLFTPAQ